MSSLPLALTMGEPAGIGGEITLKTWKKARTTLAPFFVIDDINRLHDISRQLGWDIPLTEISDPSQTHALFDTSLPVLHRPLSAPSEPGVLNPDNAVQVIGAIELAVSLTLDGKAAGVVTNPIHKQALYGAGFKFPGHTEFLAELAGITTPPIMMLACDELRVVPITVHVSLQTAINQLSHDMIVEKCRITARDLQRHWGMENPKLALAGLNPHAGEGGEMGREDMDIIAPAVQTLRDMGINATGPFPPDTLFHKEARQHYDVAMCMYHDQGLIPLKTLAFDEGVNVTLGLPYIRTSPDHGTALNIAGTGQARENSLCAALKMAADMASRT